MRRLTLALALALAAAPVQAASAQAAAPVVNSFSVAATSLDTTRGDATTTLSVSYPGGITAVDVYGFAAPATAPGAGVPSVYTGGSPPNLPAVQRVDVTLTVHAPAGYARAYPLKITAFTPDGEFDLSAQVGVARRTITTRVTAAPPAPVGLKVTKRWVSSSPPAFPSWTYVADATWSLAANSAAPSEARITASSGCGKGFVTSGTSAESADASLFSRCTATVRLANDAGVSAPVTAHD